MDVTFLLAYLVSVQVGRAEEGCLLGMQDSTSLMQLDVRHTTFQSHVPSARDCYDRAATDAYIQENRDQSTIDRYKEEGKISEHGMPILQLVHIPKTGGEAIKMSGAPIGEYGFGNRNKAWKERPQEYAMNYAKGCLIEQSPPMDLSQSYAEWIYGESEVFCAVRDPIDRIISGTCFMWQQLYGETCTSDPACVDETIQFNLRQYKMWRNSGTCFWIPQVEYFKGQFGCKHVIDFDNLESEFNGLMKQYGMSDITLVSENPHSCIKGCNVTRSELSPKTIELLEEVYGEDIKLWEDLRHNRSVGGPMYGR